MNIVINNKTYEVIYKRKKIKRTYLRVTNDKKLIVSSPLKMTSSDLHKLIYDNLPWVKKQLSKIKTIRLNRNEFLLFGKKYHIEINDNISNDIEILEHTILIKNGKLPQIDDYGYEVIKKRFNKIKTEFTITPEPFITMRKMKSRWGVCHYKKGKVVMNKALIHVPLRLVDYVIYHELIHFKHPNHGKGFYEALTKVCPLHKQLKKELKDYISLL